MPLETIKQNIQGNSKKNVVLYIILGIIGIYFCIDILILIINSLFNTQRPGGCAEEGWITMADLLVINTNAKPPTCTETTSNNTLGKWSTYAASGNQCLYETDIDRLVRDVQNDYFVEGYTIIELFAYIIVPVVTALSVVYWLISTRRSKAEITFWVLITTLVYTGLNAVVKSTGGIDIAPSEASCLTHITNKLSFEAGDELQYQFMARKSDGNSCMIEGTYLGTGSGGVSSPDQPASYTGNMEDICNSDNLPLY